MRTGLCTDAVKIYKFMSEEQNIGLVANLAGKFSYSERKSSWHEIYT